MAKLPAEAYLKSPEKSERVLTFGKSEEQEQSDLKKGIARFGGFFRQPSYSEAYLKSAEILLNNATQKNELDELGLPIFYLSRHAMELKIKDLLSFSYEICDLRSRLNRGAKDVPTDKQRDRLSTSHNLRSLYDDLCRTLENLSVDLPGASFTAFIGLVERYESNPTWSRYDKHKGISHVGNEVAVPIVKMVEDLGQLFRTIEFEAEGENETLETELYYIFSNLNSDFEG